MKLSQDILRKLIKEEIDEMCGADPMQSMDMDHEHEDDHEGSMAKRQMFKTYEYAADVYNMIQDGDEFPAWIQSKMTKIADYIGAVKHYLEYDHIMGERQLTNTESDEKEKLRKRVDELNQMRPERVKAIRDRFESIPREDREAMRQRWLNLPPEERQEWHQKLRAMDPGERQKVLKEQGFLPTPGKSHKGKKPTRPPEE